MDGLLIIDKPAGLSSHDVVVRVRKIIGERRVGHTGTLDPFATGVLVVLVGRATRLAQFLSGAEKEYEAVIRFGYSTDTGDITGKRVDDKVHAKTPSPQSLRKEEIASAMAALTGELEQIPPMYSAKKIAGRKLYEHARRGEEVERQPVRVLVHEFQLLSSEEAALKMTEDETADIQARVVCSAGTYIRTLAEDLGKKLGVGAHLAELRRTRAGRFGLDDALSLEEFTERVANASLAQAFVSPGDALSHLPFLALSKEDEGRVLNGIDLQIDAGRAREWPDKQPIRILVDGGLVAIGIYDEHRSLVHPQVVIKSNQAEVNHPSQS